MLETFGTSSPVLNYVALCDFSGCFQLLFALIRKKPITSARFMGICFAFGGIINTVGIYFAYYIFNTMPIPFVIYIRSNAWYAIFEFVYPLWMLIFLPVCKEILWKRKRLIQLGESEEPLGKLPPRTPEELAGIKPREKCVAILALTVSIGIISSLLILWAVGVV